VDTSAPATQRAEAIAADGVEGNARLTASAAAVLLVLLAAEGATLPAVHALLKPHVFIGFALLPPVGLKLASTVYRFVRYYGGAEPYRRKGPPALLLRVLGPVVVLATAVLLASGVALLFVSGSSLQLMLGLHKASFVVWFAAMTVHVLGHAFETARLAPRDWSVASRHKVQHASIRRWVLAVSVLAGALLGAWSLGHLGQWALGFGGLDG
jgi:hypothetical protein